MKQHKLLTILAAPLLFVGLSACSGDSDTKSVTTTSAAVTPSQTPTPKLPPQDPNVSPTPRPSTIERPMVNGTLAPAPTQTDWPGITDQLTVHTDEAAIAVAKNYYQALLYANSTWDIGPFAYLSSKDPSTSGYQEVTEVESLVIDKSYTLPVPADYQKLTLRSNDQGDKLVQWTNPGGKATFVTTAPKSSEETTFPEFQVSVILHWTGTRWEVTRVERQ